MSQNTDVVVRKVDKLSSLYGSNAYCWYVVIVFILLGMFSYLDRQIIVLLIDPIRHDLGISDVQVSLLTGFAFGLLYATCGLPLAWIADRYSRRWLIFVGVSFWGLATASCGLANSFAQLFLGRVAVGMGEATLVPASNTMVGDIFPPFLRKLCPGDGITARDWVELCLGRTRDLSCESRSCNDGPVSW